MREEHIHPAVAVEVCFPRLPITKLADLRQVYRHGLPRAFLPWTLRTSTFGIGPHGREAAISRPAKFTEFAQVFERKPRLTGEDFVERNRRRGREQRPRSIGLQTAEATPAVVAFVVVDYLPVRPEGDLRLGAPKRAIVAILNRGVPLRRNEHALPAEIRAAIVVNSRESSAFHSYTAFCPVASSNARFTDTLANCTL